MNPTMEPSVRLVKAREGQPRNVVTQIAGYRCAIWRKLELKLDPVRAARAAAFEARTGMDIETALLDALDDIVFDTGRQPGGNQPSAGKRASRG